MSKEVKRYLAIGPMLPVDTGYGGELFVPASKHDALLAERDALAKDAERYRWLLENADLMHWENMLRFADLEGAESINQFIDAALLGEQP